MKSSIQNISRYRKNLLVVSHGNILLLAPLFHYIPWTYLIFEICSWTFLPQKC